MNYKECRMKIRTMKNVEGRLELQRMQNEGQNYKE